MTAPIPHRLIAWRHPQAFGATGRCIGARTDLPVDPRRAKRLAHRVRQVARREGLPRVVATSPLRRCRDVAHWLQRFGFRCVVDARLVEVDFGAWDGRRWSDIARAEIDAWADDLHHHAPGGDGESVAALLARVDAVFAAPPAALLLTHGGWLSAALWRERASAGPPSAGGPEPVSAAGWPRAPGVGRGCVFVRGQGHAPHQPRCASVRTITRSLQACATQGSK